MGEFYSIERNPRIQESRVREEMRDVLGLAYDAQPDPLHVTREAANKGQSAANDYLAQFGLNEVVTQYLEEEGAERRRIRLTPSTYVAEPDITEIKKYADPGEDYLAAEEHEVRMYVRPPFFIRFQETIEACKPDIIEADEVEDRYLGVEAGYCYLHTEMAISQVAIELRDLTGLRTCSESLITF